MNRKLFVLGIWVSVLSFLGCKPGNREVVSFSEFHKSPSADVHVKFEERFELFSVVLVKSKTKLQSKTTTIINSDIICYTNIEGVLVVLPRTKRINKHLKTIRDRKPFVNVFEKNLYDSDITKIKLSQLLFVQDKTYSEYNEYLVLREVSN